VKSHFPEHIEREYRRLLTRRIVSLAKKIVPMIRQSYKVNPIVDSAGHKVKADASFDEALARILEQMRGDVHPSEYVKNTLAKTFNDVGEWTTKETVNVFKKKRGVSKLSIDLAVAQVEALRESDIVANYAEGFMRTNLEMVELAGNEYIEGIYTVAKDGYLNGLSLRQMTDQMKEFTDGNISKAKFWATDQIGDAWASYNKAAQKSAGVEKYRWRTMGDNAVRDDHRELNGKVFDWETGAAATGLLTKPGAKHPGEDYRCVSGDMKLSFNSDIIRCFRRWFTGELTEIIMVSNEPIRVTGNHPILTHRGWVRADSLKKGDYIIKITDEGIKSSKLNINNCKATAQEIFDTAALTFFGFRVPGVTSQFHGDGLSDYEVDVISIDGNLDVKSKSMFKKFTGKFRLTKPDEVWIRIFISRCTQFFYLFFRKFFTSNGIMGFLSKIKFFLFGKLGHSDNISLTSVSYGDMILDKSFVDIPSGDPIFQTTGEGTHSVDIIMNKCGLIDNWHVVCVLNVRHKKYSGYVYNFETKNNIYFVNGLSSHNCRCYSEPIFPGEE
jgi:SPP1 gp7 family putative phage head morphogenesis protein